MLRERVENFIASGYGSHLNQLRNLLRECVERSDVEALSCVSRLFEDMYGGYTYNLELKIRAAWEMPHWGNTGIDQLTVATLQRPTSKNVSICIQVLSGLAAGLSDGLSGFCCDEERLREIRALCQANPNTSEYARSKLVELVLSFDDDEHLLRHLGSGFDNAALYGPHVAKEFFSALSTRWLAISRPVLEQYNDLIENNSTDEPAFQEFFTQHPQLLDPMAITVWPRPDIHGAHEPDFVVQCSDNSYVVVEIETPSKLLVTRGNQIAAEVTHAVSQAANYRRVIEGIPTSQTYFPGIYNVSCLVVIGLERTLTSSQELALMDENRERHHLKIAGFDWLLDRARTIQENIIQNGVRARLLRIT